MRVLHLIADTDPRQGGPIHALQILSEEFGRRGHSSDILSLDTPDAAHVAGFGAALHPLGGRNRPATGIVRLRRWIFEQARSIDAAVIHGLWNPAVIGGGLALSQANVPYVVFAHGMLDPWFRHRYPLKHLAKTCTWLLVQGRILRNASSVLFTSTNEKERAENAFPGFGYDAALSPLGCAEPPPCLPDPGAALLARIPELCHRRYLLFLSRIHEKKGCDLLIEAFARIADDRPDLDLVIAGPDPTVLVPALRRLARHHGVDGRIHWPGMLTGPAKWDAFHGAEAFILPSHQENFGLVVAEALACGTPVLVTDKVNIRREIEEDGSGLVGDDTLAGVTGMLRAWNSLSPKAKTLMADRARACHARRFCAERAADDLLAALLTANQKRRERS